MNKQQDPRNILLSAIEALDVFTQPESSRLDLGEDGRLVAAKESRLERVIGLARSYIAPLFSDQLRKENQKKLSQLKKAVLQARDVIFSHSALIHKFKEGDESQRKLAESALLAIERYNAIVAQDISKPAQQETYNYDRYQLLLDQEIKGQQIELPVTHVKYDSHPNHPAHKTLHELSRILHSGASQKKNNSSTTHKNTMQFMIDTFHMKAIRMIETHLQKPVAEIVPLIKQDSPEIDDDLKSDFINMQQLIKGDAGSMILVTGCFKRQGSQSKFMTMPIPDSFRLSFQLTHTGFPYSSQHTGWALADQWTNASPLRPDQTPLFQQINQRRKRLAHRLLFDQSFIQDVRSHFKIKRDVFDQNRQLFLPLHRQLHQALLNEAGIEEADPYIDMFYQEAANAPSAFDFLTQVQQQVLDVFIHQPMRALEEEWLEGTSDSLRSGSPQEKYHAARSKIEHYCQQAQGRFDTFHFRQAHIVQQGRLLGKAFEAVGLQYQSEKMGFSPPLLDSFERKLQACAFQQLLTFLDNCEHRIDLLDPAQIKSDLLIASSKDLELIEASTENEHHLSFQIVNELECYFNSRFYQAAKER